MRQVTEALRAPGGSLAVAAAADPPAVKLPAEVITATEKPTSVEAVPQGASVAPLARAEMESGAV